MILQALTAYYEQLLKQGKVEAPGWDSKFKVSYELRLGPDGQLLALNDLRQEVPKGKKTVMKTTYGIWTRFLPMIPTPVTSPWTKRAR